MIDHPLYPRDGVYLSNVDAHPDRLVVIVSFRPSMINTSIDHPTVV